MIERAQIIDGVIRIPQSVIDEKASKDEMIYLSDFMDKLPSNCIFLKGATGVGGTSLALADDSNCIIAMPTRNTVESKRVIRDEHHNKIGYDTSRLCVLGGYNDNITAVETYMNERRSKDEPFKFVCTYDIMGKLISILTEGLSYSIEDWRLYIDEYHELIECYKSPSRRERIKALLAAVPQFNDVTCITATPLEEKYLFDQLRHLQVIRVAYPQRKKKINIIETKQIEADTARIALEHLKGLRFGNAYFFVNSVKIISSVIKKIGADKYIDQIRVICGDTETNKKCILDAVKGAYDGYIGRTEKEIQEIDDRILEEIKKIEEFKRLPIDKINSDPKKINFITKTGFQGADFFDKDAAQYIISERSKPYMMSDIATQYIQILGRIRDAKSMNVTHLFSTRTYRGETDGLRYYSPNGAMSQFEIDSITRSEERQAVMKMNEISPTIFKKYSNQEEMESQLYLTRNEETGKLEYDKYLEWADEMSFKIVHGDYSSTANFSAALWEKGFDVEVSKGLSGSEDSFVAMRKGKHLSFRQKFELYVREKSGSLFKKESTLQASFIESSDSLIYPAYAILGADRVRALKYNRRDIENEIKDRQIRNNDKKIYKYIDVEIGKTYSVVELDKKCKKVKLKLQLPDDIKITEYYDTKSTTKRENGTIVKARRILKKSR